MTQDIVRQYPDRSALDPDRISSWQYVADKVADRPPICAGYGGQRGEQLKCGYGKALEILVKGLTENHLSYTLVPTTW